MMYLNSIKDFLKLSRYLLLWHQRCTYFFALFFMYCLSFYFNVLQVSGSFRDNSIGKIKINFLISRLVIITNKEVSSFFIVQYGAIS